MVETKDSGEVVLSKDQGVQIFEHLSGQQKEEQKRASKLTGKLTAAYMLEIVSGRLATCSAGSRDTEGDAVLAHAGDEQGQDDCNHGDEESDEGDDDVCRGSFLRRLRGSGLRSSAPKAQPKVQPKATSLSTRASPASTFSSPGSSQGAGSASSSGVARPILRPIDDGRTKRLRDNVDMEIEELKARAKETCDFSGLVDLEHPLGKSQAFQVKLRERQKALQCIRRASQSLLRRVEMSKSPETFAVQCEKLREDVERKVQAAKELLSAATTKGVAVRTVVDSVAQCQRVGAELSRTFHALRLWSEVEELLLHGKLDAVFAALRCDSVQMGMLSSVLEGDTSQAQDIVVSIIEDYVLRNLGRLKANDFALPLVKSQTREALHAFVTSFSDATRTSEAEHRYMVSLKEDMQLLHGVLHPEVVGYDDAVVAVSKLEVMSNNGDGVEGSDAPSPIKVCLASAPTCHFVIEHARSVIAKRDAEMRSEVQASKVFTALESLERLMSNEGASASEIKDAADEAWAMVGKLPGENDVSGGGAKMSRAVGESRFEACTTRGAHAFMASRVKGALRLAVAWMEGSNENLDVKEVESVVDKFKGVMSKAALESAAAEEPAYEHCCRLVFQFASAVRRVPGSCTKDVSIGGV